MYNSQVGCTSGVSAGQIMPQCVLCSCRGLASFPSLPMGEFSLRRWDSVEAKVRRLSTWETPALVWWAFRWSPQFPVAREYFSPSVMVFVLMASSRLKSWEKKRMKERERSCKPGWKVKLSSAPSSLYFLCLTSRISETILFACKAECFLFTAQ